jgi:hypothetical protein
MPIDSGQYRAKPMRLAKDIGSGCPEPQFRQLRDNTVMWLIFSGTSQLEHQTVKPTYEGSRVVQLSAFRQLSLIK